MDKSLAMSHESVDQFVRALQHWNGRLVRAAFTPPRPPFARGERARRRSSQRRGRETRAAGKFGFSSPRSAFLIATAASADTYPRQNGIDVLHYVFKLDLADESDVIAGEATIELRFVADGTATVSLDLASQAAEKGMNA